MPGVKPSEVQVELEGNTLIVQSRSTTQREEREDPYWYTERVYGSFYRSIPLPSDIMPDNIQAQFKDGGLEIVVPGAAHSLKSQRRSIPIQRSQSGQSAQPIQGTQSEQSAQPAPSEQQSSSSQHTTTQSTSNVQDLDGAAAHPTSVATSQQPGATQ